MGKASSCWVRGKRAVVRRWVADFALAFILFWAVALSFGAGQSRAYAVSLPALAKEAIMPDSAASRPASLRADRPSQAANPSRGHRPVPSRRACC